MGDATADRVAPTFSVVIPSYNRAHQIVSAVGSVLAQNYRDLEVIVIDDGSTDDSLVRLRVITDPRLRVIPQQNQGASAARNRGIDEARGRYVAFLDSDDRFLPTHLSDLVVLLDTGEDVAAYSQIIADRGNGRRIVKPPRSIRADENMATYIMCDRGFVQTSGLAVPRAMAAATRYRTDVAYGDDADFAIRLQLAGCRFVMTPTSSVIWSDDPRDDRLSQASIHIGDMKWLEDLRPLIPPRAYLGYRGWHLAKSLRETDMRAATGHYLRALVNRAYGPRLAVIVLLQIYMPGRTYRRLADRWIGVLGAARRLIHGSSAAPEDGAVPGSGTV